MFLGFLREVVLALAEMSPKRVVDWLKAKGPWGWFGIVALAALFSFVLFRGVAGQTERPEPAAPLPPSMDATISEPADRRVAHCGSYLDVKGNATVRGDVTFRPYAALRARNGDLLYGIMPLTREQDGRFGAGFSTEFAGGWYVVQVILPLTEEADAILRQGNVPTGVPAPPDTEAIYVYGPDIDVLEDCDDYALRIPDRTAA